MRRLLGQGGADEADGLRADGAAGGAVFEQGEGLGGAVAAVGDVEEVFGAGGEGDDVDGVDPGGRGDVQIGLRMFYGRAFFMEERFAMYSGR